MFFLFPFFPFFFLLSFLLLLLFLFFFFFFPLSEEDDEEEEELSEEELSEEDEEEVEEEEDFSILFSCKEGAAVTWSSLFASAKAETSKTISTLLVLPIGVWNYHSLPIILALYLYLNVHLGSPTLG